MKTIGLIGGMSWESTAHYYATLNKLTNERLGGNQFAKLLLYSINFGELAELQEADRWDEANAMMADAARHLEDGGAECVLICANTMHLATDVVQQSVKLPLIHVIDVTGEAIRRAGFKRVGLLGTAFTMNKPFYRERLEKRFGLEVVLPEDADRAETHRIIFEELIHGRVEAGSKARLREIIARMVARGAEGMILGCTELMMIVEPSDSEVPTFDTMRLHCEAALAFALE